MEVQGYGVGVYVFDIPEVDLAFGLIVGGGERELHRDDPVVGHAHLVDQQVADQARVTDDQIERVSPVVRGYVHVLSEVKAVQ